MTVIMEHDKQLQIAVVCCLFCVKLYWINSEW